MILAVTTAWFRVTDERGWSHEFRAHNSDELRIGIREGWDAWISSLSTSGDMTHPAFALVTRLAEIRAWLTPRLGRANATDEQRASWEAQARHWTHEANRDLGGACRMSPLKLHVQADDGTWCTLMRRRSEFDPTAASPNWGCDPIAPSVARTEMPERCAILFDGATRMVEWARTLDGFARGVGEMVRSAQFPKPKLVR